MFRLSAIAYLFPLALVLTTTTATTVGCGDSGSGLGNDAGTNNTGDASTIPDGGPDLDEDQDGYPASEDCDDNDDTIFPGVSRSCTSICSTGIQICLSDGTWLGCTASTDCDCTMPGDIRQVDCGNCGSAQQECGLDLIWSFPGDCTDEGECAPGEEGQDTCQFCGTGIKTCENNCQWGPADCFGVCTQGATEISSSTCANPYELAQLECDAQCAWVELVACSDGCIISPRVGGGDYKDEVCVFGSPFVMGSDPGEGNPDEEPEHIVDLTPYLIDIYEVTNGRYAECVAAGVCPVPDALATYWDPGHEAYPITHVTSGIALAFCNWDGGRTLPTEAQWEKAARGPFPREVENPWGDTPATCENTGAGTCPGGAWRPVDSLPLGVSYYGLYQMAANVQEWCLDYYDPAYYSASPLLDPTGPSTGTQRVARGCCWNNSLSYIRSVSKRAPKLLGFFNMYIGFRCARPGY